MKSLFKSFRWIYSRATLLGVIKTGLSKHYRHFSLTFIVLIILSSTPIASAELYRISGSAIFSNTPPVAMEEVRIECSEFEYDCHTFEGIFSETNRNGIYEIEIELDDSYDGAELTLTLLGESFPHIIDLNASRLSPTKTVIQDIELEQKSPPSPVFTGFACASIVFILAFFAALFRPNYADNGKGFRQSLSSEIVTCPVCEGKLEKHLLIRHLIVEHEVFPDEAAKIGSLAKTEEE